MSLVPTWAYASIFGEGFTSEAPGSPSDIRLRVFTIYTREESCERSPVVDHFKIIPSPLYLEIGDRIHRTNVNEWSSEIVVEAYDENDRFLPSVPIFVSLIDEDGIATLRSDWDYFEATHEGEAILTITWACPNQDNEPIEANSPIVVVSNK